MNDGPAGREPTKAELLEHILAEQAEVLVEVQKVTTAIHLSLFGPTPDKDTGGKVAGESPEGLLDLLALKLRLNTGRAQDPLEELNEILREVRPAT